MAEIELPRSFSLHDLEAEALLPEYPAELDAQTQTLVPAITGDLNRETTTTDQVEAWQQGLLKDDLLFLLGANTSGSGAEPQPCAYNIQRDAPMKDARPDHAVLTKETDISKTAETKAMVESMVDGVNDASSTGRGF